jgi:hypothetical protein
MYVLSLLNPLTYDQHNFTNIHSQTKPPKCKPPSFSMISLSIPNLIWGFWGFWKPHRTLEPKCTVPQPDTWTQMYCTIKSCGQSDRGVNNIIAIILRQSSIIVIASAQYCNIPIFWVWSHSPIANYFVICIQLYPIFSPAWANNEPDEPFQQSKERELPQIDNSGDIALQMWQGTISVFYLILGGALENPPLTSWKSIF